MTSRIIRKLRNLSWYSCRLIINKITRSKLKVSDVTVISNDCTGGILLHDLGLQFLSPTVNLYMSAPDYQKFCQNLQDYMRIDNMVQCVDPSIMKDLCYPVAYLDDILLYLVHYATVEEAQKKWNERKRRINWDKIVVINSDRNGMTDDLKSQFEKLPYKKVMFTNLPNDKFPSSYYLPGSESEECLGLVPEPIGWLGKRRTDSFDFVEFLNNA